MERSVGRLALPPGGRTTRSSLLLALLVLLLAGGPVLAAAEAVRRQVDAAALDRLDQRAAALEIATAGEAERYAAALTVTAAGLAALPQVDQASFRTATAPLLDLDLAGATSIVFVTPPVATADIGALQERWRARGSTDLVLAPAEDTDVHVFSVFSDPLDGSEARRTGIDVSAAPAPYAALTEAARTGQVALTEPYTLIIDQDLPEDQRQASFAMTAPVLRPTDGGPQLVGWVLMGIRGGDFMGEVLAEASQGAVDVDLSAASAAGLVDVAQVRSRTAGTRDLTRAADIRAVGRTWTLEVSAPSGSLLGAGRYVPNIVLGGGLMVALLLAGLTLVLASQRARARTQVAEATAELVTAEAEARRQAGLLGAVLDSIGDGVGVVDEHGAFLIHNPAAKRLLGVEDEGVGDVDVPDEWQEHYGIFDTDGSPYPVERLPLMRALAGESTDEVEMVVRNRARPEGVRIAVSGRPLDAPGQRGAVAIFRDVTVDREQRAELAAFAGVVAHDLKHPLTVIIGFLELLGSYGDGPDGVPAAVQDDQRDHFVARALASARRMDDLIQDLLDYTTARDATLSREPVDLTALAQEVVAEHLSRAGDAEAPIVHVGCLPTVSADPDRLRQVFANLVGNAIKYTAPGQRPLVEITAVGSEEAVTILVSDRGIEIPEDQRLAIFQPFHRAHRDGYAGTGLGLAICHRVVSRHGGTLAVRDNPGGGSVFVMTLPRSALLSETPSGADHRCGEALPHA